MRKRWNISRVRNTCMCVVLLLLPLSNVISFILFFFRIQFFQCVCCFFIISVRFVHAPVQSCFCRCGCCCFFFSHSHRTLSLIVYLVCECASFGVPVYGFVATHIAWKKSCKRLTAAVDRAASAAAWALFAKRIHERTNERPSSLYIYETEVRSQQQQQQRRAYTQTNIDTHAPRSFSLSTIHIERNSLTIAAAECVIVCCVLCRFV